MKPAEVLRTLHEQRRFWVECANGVAVQMRRPLFADLVRWGTQFTLDDWLDLVVGWRGVTSRMIVGAAGDDDPLEFDAQLAREWLRDQAALLNVIVPAAHAEIERAARAQADAGNA